LAELGGQESLHEIPGHFRADRTSAHAEDIHVIILDALLGGEMIVDETGANAGFKLWAPQSTTSWPAALMRPTNSSFNPKPP
jgi:hypothetical protein